MAEPIMGAINYCRDCLNLNLGPYEMVERDQMVETATIRAPSVTKKVSKVNVSKLEDCFRHMIMRNRGSTWATFQELCTVLTNAHIGHKEAKSLARGYFRQCEIPLHHALPTQVFVDEYIKLQWHILLMTFRARYEAFGAKLHNGVMFDLSDVGAMLVKRLGKERAALELEILKQDLGKKDHIETRVAWEEMVVWYLQREEDVRVARLGALSVVRKQQQRSVQRHSH